MRFMLFSVLLSLSSYTLADEPVEQLVDLLGQQFDISAMQQQMVALSVQSDPSLRAYQSVIYEWATRYMTWNNMRDEFIRMYRRHFTEQDIKDLLSFYQTPVGQKALVLMPTLMQEGSQISADLAQQYKPELIERLKAAQSPE